MKLRNKKINIYNDDCFKIFNKIGDKTIDLFLLDLPYNQTACKWDIMIDLDKMWIEIKRMMKPNATIIFFTTTKFGYKLIQSNEKWFKYDLVWEKSRKVGYLSANKMPLRQHEMIYVFKKEQGNYNPQKTEGHKPRDRSKNKKDIINIVYGNIDTEKGNNTTDKRHPTSIVKFNNPFKTIHRTQKPVDLCEWLIKTYSNENDIVLDFCMGSGTSGEASFNTNRQFIGIEKDEEIFDLAHKRLKELKGG